MRAINHAISGAIIGLSIEQPLLATPLAFQSHFVQDAIPHHDPPGDELHRIKSKTFDRLLIADALACFLVVIVLAIAKPHHWLLAAICAFLATSPDLFWIPKYIQSKRQGTLKANTNVFWRFHHWIQWKTSPNLWLSEVLWFVIAGGILVTKI